MTAILKREFASYFTSPLGYVYLAVFYGFSGLFLWLSCLLTGKADMSGTFFYMFFVMIIIIPLLTMRTMADDKRQKTDQLTLTSPVSLFGIVFGKFLAAFLIFMVGAAVMLIYAIGLSAAVSDSGGSFAWNTFFGNFVGIILIGSVFISAGVFISSLTENQMIAAIGSIGVNLLLCLFDVLTVFVPIDFIKAVMSALTVLYKYQEFTYGIFSFKNILFFLSLTAVFNFLTMRVIERRRYS